MPLKNFHSARINEPSKYVKIRYGKDAGGKGIDFEYGIKEKGDEGPKGGRSEVQAIRFDIKKFTPAEAKKWLKNNNYKYIKFEPAKELKEHNMLRFKEYIDEKFHPLGIAQRIVSKLQGKKEITKQDIEKHVKDFSKFNPVVSIEDIAKELENKGVKIK